MTTRPIHYLARSFVVAVTAFVLILLVMPGSDAQADNVLINELQPRNATTITDGDDSIEDWIELRNPTNAPVDLMGWFIEDSGARWPFPDDTMVPANGFLLVWASDKGDPENADHPGPAGQLHANFKLDGDGDSVTLIDSSLLVVDTVTYARVFADDESYGRDADGDFVVFAPAEVTPNAPNGAPVTPTPVPEPGPPSIVINEVMAANNVTIQDNGGTGNFEDWFELYNPTCETVDLTGWSVRDSGESWTFPDRSLAPGELLFIWASKKGDPEDEDFPGPPGELHTNFRLSAAGEDLSLVDNNNLLIAMVNPGVSVADESYALTADETYGVLTGAAVTPGALNPEQTMPDCTPTPTPVPPTPVPTAVGPTPVPTVIPTPVPEPSPTPVPPTPEPTAVPTPTACASQVVINEAQSRNDRVIVDGDGDFSDWIELFNPMTAEVDLSGWQVQDSGNSFTLAAGTVLPAQSFLLVWASDKGDPTDPDFPGPAGEIHAGFKLSGDGDVVVLNDASGCVIDELALPALEANESYGMTRDGAPGRFDRGFTTPLAPNGEQTAGLPITCYSPDSPIRIDQIVAKNDGLRVDADGDESDFIELRNTGFDPVDLSVWQISDESDTWVIPGDVIIAGYDTLVIWASDKGDILDEGYPGPAGELHANFKLSSDGEQVTLAEPSECIVEQLTYPALSSNQMYGFDEQDQRGIIVPGVSSAPCAAPGSVQIVAIQAKNDSARSDEDGEFGDWFELSTATGDDIDLTGWILGDDGDSWVIPDGVVLAAATDLLVWADEKNRGSPDAALHTNFKLGGDGETITVSSAAGCLVDAVTYPALEDDQVYRRDQSGNFTVEGTTPQNQDPDDSQDGADSESGSANNIVVAGTCVAINEIMAKNDSTLDDENGEFGDWIELVNLSDATIDLSGYTITDKEDSWTIPDGVEIGGGEFLLLWADGGDSGAAGEELHTNFKLSGDGEPLTLVTADGQVVALITNYPELDDDESFGVNVDGDYVVITAGEATPGDGPIFPNGCDFEVAAGSAPTDDDGDSSADAGSAAIDSQSTTNESLATTGVNTNAQALLSQLTLTSGVALLAMARISRRRSGHTIGV